MLTVASCLVLELEFGLASDLVSGWLVVMHTYLYYLPLSFYRMGLLLEGSYGAIN